MFKKRHTIGIYLFEGLVSLGIVFLFILSIPWNFDKYSVRVVWEKGTSEEFWLGYDDLNKDGSSERMILREEQEYRSTLMIQSDSSVIGQWDFRGRKEDGRPPVSYLDTDQDGVRECLYFRNFEDSIFVFVIHPDMSRPNNPRRLFIDTIAAGIDSDNQQCYVFGVLPPTEGKGAQLLVAINGAFHPKPRAFYAIDLITEEVKRSPPCHAALHNPILVKDPKSAEYYLTATTAAYNNSDSAAVYPDQILWFYVLNQDLEFVFEPIAVGAYSSSCQVSPITIGDELFWSIVSIHQGPKPGRSITALYSTSGELIRMNLLQFEKANEFLNFPQWDSIRKHLNIMINGVVHRYDIDLNLLSSKKVIPDFQAGTEVFADIDGDGRQETFLIGGSRDFIWMFDQHLEHPCKLPINLTDLYYWVSPYLSHEHRNQFHICTSTMEYLLERRINHFRYLIPLIWLLAWGLAFIALELLIRYRGKLAGEKKQMEEDLLKLQYIGIQRQFEPHFTFNVLNNIRSLYEADAPEDAELLLSKYTRLLRTSLVNRQRILIPIGEEMDFLSDYLLIEKKRKPGIFDYRIDCPDNLVHCVMPRTLVFTLAENAVKHAFAGLDYPGMLTIRVVQVGGVSAPCKGCRSTMSDEWVEIEVSDNGVGMGCSGSSGEQSSKTGLKLAEEMIELVRKKYHLRIDFSITSAANQGTTARIRLFECTQATNPIYDDQRNG